MRLSYSPILIKNLEFKGDYKDMTKQQLVKKISEETSLTQKDVAAVLDTFQNVVKEAVVNDDKIALTGFLTFSKKHVPAKSGVTKLGGVEKPWSTPEKDEVSVKLSKSYKAI